QGFFGMLAAADEAVVAALIEAAADWLRARGRKLMRGPYSLSVNQTSGLLVDGFDTPPFVLMDHNPPWLGPAVERCGLRPAKNLLAYLLDLSDGLPDRPRRLVAKDWPGLTLRKLDKRRFPEEIRTVATIFNDAWADNWGFIPLTEAEIEGMARDLKPLLDPDLVRIAELDGEPAAFIVILPNLNEAIADLNGRLLPFGWAKLLWRLKVAGVGSARVPLMGVRRAVADTFIGKTLPLRMIYDLEARCAERGIVSVELSWLLEDNAAVIALAESVGGRLSKTYRIYETPL
ncbi:MAG: dATP pyrophosphohydrolase, partial [Pseudomonadota bacterium]